MCKKLRCAATHEQDQEQVHIKNSGMKEGWVVEGPYIGIRVSALFNDCEISKKAWHERNSWDNFTME
jgi:hypothetical protein